VLFSYDIQISFIPRAFIFLFNEQSKSRRLELQYK